MKRRGDALAIAVLIILPFLFFWPVIFGGATLVPADNLYQWQPWQSQAPQLGVGAPHNELLSDLVLENYAWKLFLRRSISAGELPLWNPYLFTGVPFLAAGQHSALYPFSLLFYVLPLERAYGIFSALQLALAAVGAYAFAKAIGANRGGAFVAGAAYAFSSFMVVSVAFTMVIAAAAWLPWCLWAVERLIGSQRRLRDGLPWLVLGAVFLGMQVLAGHVEITYYVVIILAYYSAARLAAQWWRTRRAPWRPALLLMVLVALGVGLGSVQLLPLYELVQTNFRSGAAAYQVTYDDVIGWAYPLRQLAAFAVPDIFGNPSIHRYLDVLSLHSVPITTNALGEAMDQVAWGKGLSSWKNYVEGSAYVGVLPLLLAVPALLSRRLRRYSLPLGALAAVSLLFVFGTPLYRLVFLLPGMDQLHTPFRWVFPYTLSLAILAGLGITALADDGEGAART
ncbi:MAG: YfhO family protein, partial [Anaerolineae bacterium]